MSWASPFSENSALDGYWQDDTNHHAVTVRHMYYAGVSEVVFG